jgi:hypothetical protein
VPDPLSILRLAALLIFIGLVAVGLWLLDVAWWVVPPVMAVALLIAWTIEWLAWRGSLATTVIRDTPVPVGPLPPVAEPPPAEAIVPPAAAAAEPAAPEPPEPSRQPEPRAPAPEPPARPESRREPEPQLETRPEGGPEPEPVPEPAPEPPPEPAREPKAPESGPEAERPPEPVPTVGETVQPPPQPRRARRLRLRSVPPPREREPEALPPPPPTSSPSTVVAFQPRTYEPRSWNLWDLERIGREEARDHPERRDEFSFLFVHLRQFADADGSLPAEFDGLVRESFAGLLEHAPGR